MDAYVERRDGRAGAPAPGEAGGLPTPAGADAPTARTDDLSQTVAFLAAVLPALRRGEVYRIALLPPERHPRGLNNFLDIKVMARALVRYGGQVDAYFAVSTFPTGSRDRKAEHALRAGCAWADLDCGQEKPHPDKESARAALRGFSLRPHVVIDSGRGLHAYWLLSAPAEGAELARLKAVVERLAVAVGGDQVADLARVLRPPGTFNLKEGDRLPVTLESLDTERRRYRLEELEDALASYPPRGPGEGNGRKLLPERVPVGGRNTTLTSVAGSLRRRGANAQEIEAAIGAINASRGDPPLSAAEIAGIARSVARYEPGTGRVAPEVAGSPCSDIANAERLVRLHGADLRWVAPWRSWLVWDGTRWKRDEREMAMRYAQETARSIYAEAAAESDDARRAALAKWAIQSERAVSVRAMLEMARPMLAIDPKKLDADPWLLNCLNGTIDLKTGILPAARSRRPDHKAGRRRLRPRRHRRTLGPIPPRDPARPRAPGLRPAPRGGQPRGRALRR